MAAQSDTGFTDYSTFKAVTRTRTGTFNLDMAPEKAFPLFTAPGETLWIPNWEPFVLHGDGSETGTVWVTQGQGKTTYWYVAAFDADARHARYIRVTPGASTGTVDVKVAPDGKGGSTVSVTYRLTGLSEVGNAAVELMLSEADYAAMMDEWRAMIDRSRATIDAHFAA